MRATRLVALALVLAACLTSVRPAARGAPFLVWLDRYAAGQFDAVSAELEDAGDFGAILGDLRDQAAAWIAAGPPADHHKRRLVAATFALEAARAGEWREWKWIQNAPEGPLPVLSWKPPALLLEWGCALLAQEPAPGAVERIWQLAALGVAQRSEDPQFQIGDTSVVSNLPAEPPPPRRPGLPPFIRGPRRHPDEVLNTQDEIRHLNHTMERFPGEKRFMLAQGIARERATPAEAIAVYTSIADDPAVGGEARMRLGALFVRQSRIPDALQQFDRAERLTRDPYVIHLARFFRGQAQLRRKQEEAAIEAFRGALAAYPAAQSASVALAELLFNAGNRTEAQAVMAGVLSADPGLRDPYLEYMHADDRFWSELIGRVRAEIRR